MTDLIDPDTVLARAYPDLSDIIVRALAPEDLAALIRARYVRRRNGTYVWTKAAHATAKAWNCWGVKCLTDVGWLGEKTPTELTEDQARREADRLNTDPDEKDTWEARRLPASKGKGRR